MDILSTDVRNVFLKPMLLHFENQKRLPAMCGAERLAPQVDTEFQRHVKSRKAGNYIQCDCGQIVDSESAFLNDPFDY